MVSDDKELASRTPRKAGMLSAPTKEEDAKATSG